jgi:cytochrome d ubiquinol oxidase subunit I
VDTLLLARLQFAVTTVYHFFFVPLTLGLALTVAIMQTIYYRTGNELWKRMTKFWGKLFVINFALGVVTGIVQEFQFGMNWSEYSRMVGDIFGAPLAIEALLAFFLESVFIGFWIFGWDRVKKGLHLASIWIVAIASHLSAFWILVANSFMQEPVGFELRTFVMPGGQEAVRAEMTNFLALLGNPMVWVQFPHVVMSGLTTAGFFLLGISAWHLWRRTEHRDLFRRSWQTGVVAALIGSVGVAFTGHSQMQHMVVNQPMKVAAAEALWNSEDPASLSLFTIGDETNREDVFSIRVPGLLSFLSFNQFSGTVRGINELQAEYQERFADRYGPDQDYVPPVAIAYWTFRAMVGFGVLMIGLALFALFLTMTERFEKTRWFLRILPYAIILPYAANTNGWLLTEIGRQPWLVFGVQLTAEGVSPNVASEAVLLSLVLFTAVYGALMAVDIYLLNKFAKTEIPPAGQPAEPEPAPAVSL